MFAAEFPPPSSALLSIHCSNLFRLDVSSFDDVGVSGLDRFGEGTEGVAVELEEQAFPREARVDDKSRQFHHDVCGVTASVGTELILQAVDQLAVVRNVSQRVLFR